MKKQITVIKSLNETIQKFQFDEETFNKNIKEIHELIMNIFDQLNY